MSADANSDPNPRGSNRGHPSRGHHGQDGGFGGGPPQQPPPHQGGGSGFMQQQQQDFSSWRNPMAAVSAGMNPADAAYNSFYYSGAGYTPFSAGDMRDSIAAIWSRTSPSGEGVAAFSGGYGQFQDSSNGQFAANSNPAGQFAANLTGHFATSDLSMFGAGGDYSAAAAAYGQQYNYNNQYTQWGENAGGASGGRNGGTGYSYLGVAHGEEVRGHRERVTDVQHGLEGMKLGGHGGGGKKGESNGYQQSQPKKMSWANVASQPAKPQAPVTKTKKPGVLPPPAMIPSSKPALSSNNSAPLTMSTNEPPPPSTSKGEDSMVMGLTPNHAPPLPPPPLSHPPQQEPRQQQQNHREESGPPPRSNLSSQGPRANRVTVNGGGAGGGGVGLSGGMSGVGGRSASGGGGSGALENSKTHPVLETLKSANEYNPKSFDMNPKNARYFVIKSFSEDDIHRSIKYEIWCSTDHGNKRLDAAFKERNSKGPIFLLFSVNGSGHFCGMAQMLSGVDYNTASNVWVQDKFKGQFKVKWIYVKDVPNGQLRHIRLENNENKPVTNSRDTQEVPPEKGKMVLKIIHGYKHQTSIFDDFFHYEKRQEEEGKKNAGMIPGMTNANNNEGNSRGGNSSGSSGGGGVGKKNHYGNPRQ